jgi:hypothetical protein
MAATAGELTLGCGGGVDMDNDEILCTGDSAGGAVGVDSTVSNGATIGLDS